MAILDGQLFWDLFAQYQNILRSSPPSQEDSDILSAILDYYRFFLRYQVTISTSSSPSKTFIALAVNMYENSFVSKSSRKWIRRSDTHWVDWVNRSKAKGDPLATLNVGIIATGRDTFEERVCIVGVRSDGRRVVKIYDSTVLVASASGGTAKLEGELVLDENDQEDGSSVVCSFSRDGSLLAISTRSVSIYNASDLSFCRSGVDPDLTDGDVVTALVWTKGDNFIVTASDGDAPGRVVIWDARSMAIIRIVDEDFPRQPIAVSLGTIGFWDEMRQWFVLLHVDEFVNDPDSPSAIQYIQRRAHTQPSPDGCSRLALAHRGPFALLADDDGKGYTLLNFTNHSTLAKIPMDVDGVRQIALSPEGNFIAIVPNDSPVIFIFGLITQSKESNALDSFSQLGTVLGTDPRSSTDCSLICCLFSRSGNTILTEGENYNIRIWDRFELGDHSNLNFKSTLNHLPPSILPIENAKTGAPLGWVISNGGMNISLVDLMGRSRVLCHDLPAVPAQSKDAIIGVASCISPKPLIACISESGTVSLVSVGNMGTSSSWVGSVGSLISKRLGLNTDVAKTITQFNTLKLGTQSNPTFIAFFASSTSKAEVISFVTGHEDGSVSIWECLVSSVDTTSSLQMTLRLNLGRITKITVSNSGNRTMAIALEGTVIILWNGLDDDPETSVKVLVPPNDTHGHFYSELRSDIQQFSQPIEFSHSQDSLLATGTTKGTIVLWNTNASVSQTLQCVTPTNNPTPSSSPVVAIAWSFDDATIASITHDSALTLHDTVTAQVIWTYSLAIIPSPLANVCFSSTARDVSLLSIDGTLTVFHLNGTWPVAPSNNSNNRTHSQLIPPSASRGSVRFSSQFPQPAEPDFIKLGGWDSKICTWLMDRRNKLSKSVGPEGWMKSTGSGAHGHVALLEIPSLERGTYEVSCDIEINTQNQNDLVPLLFISGLNSSEVMGERGTNEEWNGVRGFTRLFPIEEQMELAGLGMSRVRLGYIKTVCRIDVCVIDLKRIPGDGQPVALGTVHVSISFLPIYVCNGQY